MLNLLKLCKSLFNFEFQLRQALHEPLPFASGGDNDQRMIKKLYTNYFFDITAKLLSIAFCVTLMYNGGAFSVSYFPMAQIFMVQHTYKLIKELTREIRKLRQFRLQLADIDSSYPVVEYGDHPEECAICKENMKKARKLPCGHAFHWFCIVQLIESGSKNCPICRAEFHNNR